MNVSYLITRDYEYISPLSGSEKTKPIFETTKTNANLFAKKGYEKNRAFGFRKNKAKQSQTKPMLVRHQCGGSEAKNAALHLFAVGCRTKIIMLFKSLSGKCRLKIMFALYPIIW